MTTLPKYSKEIPANKSKRPQKEPIFFNPHFELLASRTLRENKFPSLKTSSL
jgi:hypothetical protein